MTVDIGPFVDKWLQFEPEGRLIGNFLPRGVRGDWCAFSALAFELESVALGIAEPAVAEAKLGWWREELAHAGRGEARHPLTLSLTGGRSGVPLAALADPLIALYRFESTGTMAGLDALVGPWVYALTEVAVDRFGGVWPARALHRAFLVRRLRELEPQARLGRLWLPLDRMAAEGIARHHLAEAGDRAAGVRARRVMARALLDVENILPRMYPAAAMGDRLACLRIEVMARDGSDALPPLRALWRAWRAAGGR